MLSNFFSFCGHLIFLTLFSILVIIVYRKVIQNGDNAQSILQFIRSSILNVQVFGAFYLSIVLGIITILISIILPHDFIQQLSNQSLLIKHYVDIIQNTCNLLNTHKLSIQQLSNTILTKQFSLQNVFDFVYTNRLIFLTLFIVWFINLTLGFYTLIADPKREKIKYSTNIVYYSVVFYSLGLLFTIYAHAIQYILTIVTIETLIFWCIVIATSITVNSINKSNTPTIK